MTGAATARPTGPRGRRPRHPRLFWRIYANGILLLVAIAATSMAAAHLFDIGAPWRDAAGRLVRAVFEGGPTGAAGPPGIGSLAERVAALSRTLRADIAVYGPDGTALAATENAPPPPDADERRELGESGVVILRAAVHVALAPESAPPGAASVAVRWWPPPSAHRNLLIFLVIALFVSAAVMLPAARRLARPLERVAAAARALGEGDLGARSGVRRRYEIGVMAAAFDEMAGRVQTLVVSERELLANVSHELRTPLARLSVALELCEDEADPAALRAQVAGMAGDVRELADLVENVLTTARFDLAQGGGSGEAAGFAPRPAPLDFADLVARAAARFAERCPGDELVTALSPELPEVRGDAALLRRVLDNLLDNAARHGRGADGRARVELAVRPEAGGVALRVADRGPGVAADDLPRLFEPFFQADRARSGVTRRGVGLGLTLCRRIVAAHGGTTEAAHREGGGLVVTVRLPAFIVLHGDATRA